MPAHVLVTSTNHVLAISTNKRERKMPALDRHEPSIPKAYANG